MRTGTKIGLVGLVVSAGLSVVFGVIEIKDYRKGKRRLHKDDIKMIAGTVVEEQNRLVKEGQKNSEIIEEK